MVAESKRVIALGFFDGVHLGHAALINKAKERAAELGGAPAVLTFDIYPEQVISGRELPLINSAAGRVDVIGRIYGVDDVLIVHFDEEMRTMPWQEFVRHLRDNFAAIHLVVGHDFRFGYKGRGTSGRLVRECGEMGIGCDIIPEVRLDGVRISSTLIRTCIAAGDIERANRFLGYPHTLVDTVRYGYRLGRIIGAPTINMVFPEGVLVPAFGVYAAKVYLKDREYLAVTNVGVRPTVGGSERATVESYILDFSGDIYGRQVRVAFHKFLRPEMKFSDISQLKAQIQKDVRTTRAYFLKQTALEASPDQAAGK